MGVSKRAWRYQANSPAMELVHNHDHYVNMYSPSYAIRRPKNSDSMSKSSTIKPGRSQLLYNSCEFRTIEH